MAKGRESVVRDGRKDEDEWVLERSQVLIGVYTYEASVTI